VRHLQQNALATVIRGLAAEKSPACLLDTQGTFLFVNDAWDRHALQNGGAPGCLGAALIGTSWLTHIRGEEVQRFHAALFERALRSRSPRPRPVIQVGESNTPTTAALVSSRLELIQQGDEPFAVSVVHTTIRERPVAEVYELVEGPPDAYRQPGGKIVQCSCCRRVRHPSDGGRWDFVPSLLAAPLVATQTVCELCAELHYVGVELAPSEPAPALATGSPAARCVHAL
jgi:hypothetical protein